MLSGWAVPLPGIGRLTAMIWQNSTKRVKPQITQVSPYKRFLFSLDLVLYTEIRTAVGFLERHAALQAREQYVCAPRKADSRLVTDAPQFSQGRDFLRSIHLFLQVAEQKIFFCFAL